MPPPSSDDAFTTTLNAAEEYMALQQALAAALRSGFLSLAQARYSMGAERVSVLQLPTHMTATARLRVSGEGDLELAVTEAKSGQAASRTSSSSNGGSGGAGATAPQAGEAAGTTAVSPTSAAVESVEERLQRLRIAALDSESLMEQLAAKYGCSGTGNGGGSSADGSGAGTAGGPTADDDDDDGFVEVAKPGRPLHWFGSLVAPSLRDAERHFSEGLALAVRAANVQRLLRQAMEGQKTAAPAATAAAAAAAAAEGTL